MKDFPKSVQIFDIHTIVCCFARDIVYESLEILLLWKLELLLLTPYYIAQISK